MNSQDLQKLHAAVDFLRRQESFGNAVQQLKKELVPSSKPFVWTTVPLSSLETELPGSIQSCWIFVLKEDVPSGCHYHPNSVQHMIAIEGGGRSEVGGVAGRIVPFGSENRGIGEQWYVIEQGVPHEFFPEKSDLTVVSFHTCAADELEEIAVKTGTSRLYEGA